MSVKRKAHELARALADSPEYARLQAAKQAVEERQAAKIMLEDAKRKETKLRAKYGSGEDITEAELEDLQKTLELVSFNPYIRELMEAEYAFSETMMEVWEIITEAVGIEQPDMEISEPDEPEPKPTTKQAQSKLWVPGQNM
ncbi:MAG: YlbF family regulator [Firmicutes bacterium]|mgnify:CR=1 FL=1|nr:YlbF family regulator [Bacillota bacterium]